MGPPRKPGKDRRPGLPLPRGHRACADDGCGSNAKPSGTEPSSPPRRLCQVEGCSSRAKRGGLCLRHGGKLPPCIVVGCANDANTVDGYCVRHGGRQKCSAEGCENLAKKGGVCCRHGAQPPTCRVEGCTTLSCTRGVCIKHGAKKYRYVCSYGDCQSRARLRGVCKKHIDEWRVCKHDGCEHIARKSGTCTRHNPRRRDLPPNKPPMAEKVRLQMQGDVTSIGLAQSDGLWRTISEEKDVTAKDVAILLIKLQHGDCRTVSDESADNAMPQMPGKKRAQSEQGAALNNGIGPLKKRILREFSFKERGNQNHPLLE